MAVSKNTIVITSKGPKGEAGAAVTVDGEAITSFSTVAVTGSTSVVADVANDTFTLTGGDNVTLSTTGSAITINATDTDTNTTYDLASAQNASNVDVTLTGSDATTDTVTLVAGANVTLTDDGSNNITVAASGTNTTYTLDTAQDGDNATITLTGSDASTDSITLAAGSNVTLTETGDTITIASTGGGGGSSITVIDESTTLTTGVTQFTFTGDGVTATEPVADQVTVTIPGESNSFGVVQVGGVSVSSATANDTLTLNTTSGSAVALTGIDVSDTVTINAYIENETDPTLGAAFDVATYPIYTTTTNGNVVVYGNGTGVVSLGSSSVNNNVNLSPGLVEVKNDGTDQSKVKLYCESSETHYVQLKSPAHSGTYVSYDFVLPETAGTSGQFLQTDGSGNTTWASGGSATTLDGQKIEYIVSSTALGAGDYEGLVLKVGDAGNTLTAGTVYYFDAAQTDWVAASNAAEATAKGVLGIALGTSGTADGVLIQGVYYYANAAGVTGDVLFLGTAGAMTATAPTADGEILRVMGQNIDDNIVMFQPSQDFVELGAAAGTTGLDDLSDVTITGPPTANQVLVYSTGTSSFENVDLAIVNDTTPQLGGDLDINGNSIVSTSNGNIAITPDGTGAVVLDGLSYPTADGAANQPLVTDGSGAISFGSTVKATLQGPVDGSDLDLKIETSAAASAGDGEGVVVYFGTGTTAQGKVYTFSSGAWVAVSAATGGEATTKGLLGMALSNSGPSGGMLLYGVGFINHDHGGAAGSILYVSDGVTTGEVTSTQPTGTGEYVRVVGHAIAANGVSGSKIFFSPSQDWIEIA